MKTYYNLIILMLISFASFSQSYQYDIIIHEGNNYSVTAIADFDPAGQIDISGIGFTIMLPVDKADIINATSFYGKLWQIKKISGSTLSQMGVSNGSQDAFLFLISPGQTLISHTMSPFELVNFDLKIHKRKRGKMHLLENDDSLAINVEGVLDSFFNANIDNTITSNYFSNVGSAKMSKGATNLESNNEQQKAPNTLDSFLLYPNPTSNELTIKTHDQITMSSLKIMDVFGIVVIEQSFEIMDEKLIDVSKLATGTYFVLLESDKKQVGTIKKLLKL